MCSLNPNGLRGFPRFTFGVQFRFIQTTDKTGASEPISSTFLTRRCFKGLNTDTRTKASFCARDALAKGLPMTEFLRVRRDLTLIGGSMAMGMRGEGKGARRVIPITNLKPMAMIFASPQLENGEETFQKVTRRLDTCMKLYTKILAQLLGNLILLDLYLFCRG